MQKRGCFCSKFKNKLRTMPALAKEKIKNKRKNNILNRKKKPNSILIQNDKILVIFPVSTSKAIAIPKL